MLVEFVKLFCILINQGSLQRKAVSCCSGIADGGDSGVLMTLLSCSLPCSSCVCVAHGVLYLNNSRKFIIC